MNMHYSGAVCPEYQRSTVVPVEIRSRRPPSTPLWSKWWWASFRNSRWRWCGSSQERPG